MWVYKGEILGKELRRREEPKRKQSPNRRPTGGKKRRVNTEKN